MDIRAIVLIGGAAEGLPPQGIAKVPMAYLDVLGLPLVRRVLQRLDRFGVGNKTVIDSVSGEGAAFIRDMPFLPARVHAKGEQFWEVAQQTCQNYAESGAELILLLRLGPYAEVDYEELIQHHLDHHAPVTMAVDSGNSPLDLFVLNASASKDGQTLLQSRLERMRRPGEPFRVRGYVNRLQNAGDLHALAVDGLLAKNAIRPEGREWKPGVWVATSARIHPRARIVAPAFIGAHATIRAAALITRASTIEHHANVDCGTVVENSSILPFTRIGAGLDVAQSVVGFRHLAHLGRGVEVEISDSRIVGMAPLSAFSRLAGSTAALFAFIPKQIYRGFFASSQRKNLAVNPGCLDPVEASLETAPLGSPATGTEASQFPSNLAVARRYGDQ